MPTDASGPPTPNYGIPTYATAADAPSGQGFNAAIIVVDSKMKLVENKVDVAVASIAAKPNLGLLIALGG